MGSLMNSGDEMNKGGLACSARLQVARVEADQAARQTELEAGRE